MQSFRPLLPLSQKNVRESSRTQQTFTRCSLLSLPSLPFSGHLCAESPPWRWSGRHCPCGGSADSQVFSPPGVLHWMCVPGPAFHTGAPQGRGGADVWRWLLEGRSWAAVGRCEGGACCRFGVTTWLSHLGQQVGFLQMDFSVWKWAPCDPTHWCFTQFWEGLRGCLSLCMRYLESPQLPTPEGTLKLGSVNPLGVQTHGGTSAPSPAPSAPVCGVSLVASLGSRTVQLCVHSGPT